MRLVSCCMNAWHKTALMSLLLLPALAVTSRADEIPVSFFYPREASHLLLFAREIQSIQLCERPQTRVKTYRLFGDGRLEVDPLPRWLQDETVVLGPKVVEQLLHSVDALLDLRALHVAETEEEGQGFVEVHLDRFVSPQHAICFLDVKAVAGLEAVFDELATLENWLIHRAALSSGSPLWVSGNPWPRPCQRAHRLELGHREAS